MGALPVALLLSCKASDTTQTTRSIVKTVIESILHYEHDWNPPIRQTRARP